MKSTPNAFPSERARRIISFLIARGNAARLSDRMPKWNERKLSTLACDRYPIGHVELPEWVFQGRQLIAGVATCRIAMPGNAPHYNASKLPLRKWGQFLIELSVYIAYSCIS
jgi:hypothetical protein